MTTRLGLAARVERRIDQLARRMVDRFVEEIPIYAQLPQEQLAGEIRRICRENLRIFFDGVRQRRAPLPAELAEPRASAARRAEERVPLAAVLTAYHLGARIGWEAMVEEAGPDEHAELIDIADQVLVYTQTVSGVVADGYVEEQQHIYGERRDALRAVTESLLRPAGGGEHDTAARPEPAVDELPRELVARAGIHLADGYLVLVTRLGSSRDERDAGVAGTVASRRKVRRVQAQLESLAGEPVLELLDPDGGPILFPVPPAEAEEALAGADALVAKLSAAAEADVLAGVAWRDGAEGAPVAAGEAREVLRLAALLGRDSGAVRLDDVLLEHAVSQPAGTAERLTALLDPLNAKPELVETLQRWFAADFDRRSAARALFVHPNTLDYRLRRVGELTGLDPSTARGMQLLGAALIARRLRGAAT